MSEVSRCDRCQLILFLLSFSFNFADLSTTCLLFSLHIALENGSDFSNLYDYFSFLFFIFFVIDLPLSDLTKVLSILGADAGYFSAFLSDFML